MTRAIEGRRFRARLLGASSYLCLALLITEPTAVGAQEYRGRPVIPGFYQHGFISIEGGFLFNASQRNLTFAPGDAFLGGFPTLRPGGNGGMAGIAFGWMIDPQWDWALRFRHNQFSNNEVATSTGIVSNRLRYQTIDGEVGFHVPMWRPANIRVFAGPRVIHAQNDISYSYSTTRPCFIVTCDKLGQYDHDVSLLGFGPRAGLEASMPLGDWPVSLNLSGAGSVLFSRATHRFDFNFVHQDFPVGAFTGSGSTRERSSRTVYNVEGSASLVYRIAPPVAVHFGYQAAQFWNLNTAVLNATSGSGAFQTGRSNVLSHGPFLRFVFDLP